MDNVRNKLKILVKISAAEDKPLEIAKIAPIVSQYGVEDTAVLDEVFLDFFEVNGVNLPKNFTFYSSANLYLFRDECDSVFIINNYEKNSLIKFFLDKKKKFFFKNYYFIFLLVNLSSRAIIYRDFLDLTKTFKGLLKSYKNRDFMKERKINFRRKFKKDTYND